MKGRFLSCTILLVAALVLAAPAQAVNVQICHVPPDAPANFHTIIVDVIVLLSHLLHGDLLGPCSASCSELCDDCDACTIDACDASGHCAATHPPVNCDDGNLCTTETCDPESGCSSTPLVCQDSNLCTVDACDPLSGQCVFPPVSCDAGQTCNPANGNCEANACPSPNPCQHDGTCQASGSGYTCTCTPGWTGTNCEIDINECLFIPSVCPPSFTCANTPGSYECQYQ